MKEKQKAALSSVVAAVFLTAMKTVVGLFTGSLGILSEAAHSALDLFAAVITLFAVQYSDKPADGEHQYGHGKIESFSALIETVLLLATCGWIIYEAVEKLFFHKGPSVIGSHWGIAVMVISIIIDSSRVKVLKKAAEDHGSQALEADALHFSSDVLSSSVVIGGLAFVWLGNIFKLPLLNYADPLAALGVSLLVIKVSIKLGKKTIDVLLDKAPDGMKETILQKIKGVSGLLEVGAIRIRPSGADFFINISVGIDPNESHRSVHSIVQEIQRRILEIVPNGDIMVGTFPAESAAMETSAANEIKKTIKRIVGEFPNCVDIHDINVYMVGEQKKVSAHVELKENTTLKDSHELSHQISRKIQESVGDIDNVSLYFECEDQGVFVEDISELKPTLTERIQGEIHGLSAAMNCHDIKIYSKDGKLSTFLHCELNTEYTVYQLEELSNRITNKLKSSIDGLESVHIHFEPAEQTDARESLAAGNEVT